MNEWMKSFILLSSVTLMNMNENGHNCVIKIKMTWLLITAPGLVRTCADNLKIFQSMLPVFGMLYK